jgi:hypothetical protein
MHPAPCFRRARPALRSLISLLVAAAAADPPRPIPLATEFSVEFAETFAGFPAAPTTGAWFSDYPRGLWRAEHRSPQANNFCACADNTTTASCALVFVPDRNAPSALPEGMYVDFFDSSPASCCRLCGAAEGCTPLRPDWLSASPSLAYAGVDGVGCDRWCVPGDSANVDCMSFARGGGSRMPCQYFELFEMGPAGNITHNLTIVADTYAEGPQGDDLFALRPECNKPCAQIFPTQCG